MLARLKKDYSQAAKTVSERIKIHDNKIEVLLKDIGKLDEAQMSILQSQIYQKRFQESLKRQIDAILDNMSKSNHKTISEYLNNCYNLGYIGTMYDLAGQGIPLSVPINQSAMLKAVTLNPKLSEKLYGGYVHQMSKHIRNEISRGIATADSYANIARNITNASKVGLNKAMRIARTEGHRIHSEAAFDAQHVAKNAGADVVKQWDSSLDGKTRETHRQLDGQIREIDEPFEVNGMEAMYPSGFGKASEDINCRCALLQRARWALDEEELQTLKERAAKHGLIVKASKGKEASKAFGQAKAKNFADYSKNFLGIQKNGRIRYNIIQATDPQSVPIEIVKQSKLYDKINSMDDVVAVLRDRGFEKIDLANLPFEQTKHAVIGICEMLDEFPKITETAFTVLVEQVRGGYGGFEYGIVGKILFAPRLKRELGRVYTTAIHEMAHALDHHMSQKRGLGREGYAEDVVARALRNLKRSEREKERLLIRIAGFEECQDFQQVFAIAFEVEKSGKGNALSKEILRIVRSEYDDLYS